MKNIDLERFLKKLSDEKWIQSELKNYILEKLSDSYLGIKLNYEYIDEKFNYIFKNFSLNDFERKNYFYFKEIINKRIKNSSNKKSNLIIESENYFALKHLVELGVKVDLIYIDPPYNTGREFVYNDLIVSDSDDFKHSKWIQFMKKRLNIARNLLKNNGLIFISIDDNEQAYLKILMDEIFGEENFVSNFIVQKKSGGGQAKFYYKGHDYLLVYSKTASQVPNFYVPDFKNLKSIILNGEEIIYDTDVVRRKHGKYDSNDGHRNVFFEDIKSVLGEIKFIKYSEEIKNGKYILVKDINSSKNYVAKYWKKGEKKKIPYSILEKFWNSEGNKELENIFGDKYKNLPEENKHTPKPTRLLKKVINLTGNKNATILDFFSGTGTTGQACLELNKEDNGKRRFILINNKENCDGNNKKCSHSNTHKNGKCFKNICDEYSYERNSILIKNNKYKENLRYLELSIIPKNPSNKFSRINDFKISNNLYSIEFDKKDVWKDVILKGDQK